MLIADVAKALKADEGYENVPHSDLVDVIRDTFTTINKMLLNGGPESRINVPGFGIFTVVVSQARKARNPKTGESIAVPAKAALKFRPSSTLRKEFAGLDVSGKAKKKKAETKGKEVEDKPRKKKAKK